VQNAGELRGDHICSSCGPFQRFQFYSVFVSAPLSESAEVAMSALPAITPHLRKVPDGKPEFTDQQPSHDSPFPKGDRNENPRGVGLLALLAEDYRTHDRDFLEPGFWAVAIHRFGNARMGVRFKLLRVPLTVVYKLTYTAMIWLWGIDLPYNTRLGRRVRIWHHGGTWLGARSIGDDVHIRHNTTFGVLNRSDVSAKPIIGNRVDVGVGACILGAVTVGDDCVIGPNSVVIRDLPPGSVVMGVPARQTAIWKDGAASPAMQKSENPASHEENHG
jgi:serine O-acetyltransferase